MQNKSSLIKERLPFFVFANSDKKISGQFLRRKVKKTLLLFFSLPRLVRRRGLRFLRVAELVHLKIKGKIISQYIANLTPLGGIFFFSLCEVVVRRDVSQRV